jgi:flagellar protein FlaG
MEFEVGRIPPIGPVQNTSHSEETGRETEVIKPPTVDSSVEAQKVQEDIQNKRKKNLEIEQYVKDLLNVSHAFNRKLKFSINRELNEVVVKVIDSETDKVIREIPPEELQKLHARIREAIGVLIDEQI